MAEETEVAEKTEKAPKVPKAPSALGKLLPIMLAVVLANAIGAGVTWFLINKTIVHTEGSGKEKEKTEINLEKSAVLPLEPFVVNLADADAARYLRIKVSLMVDDKTLMPAVNENVALQNKVRDLILQTLTRKSSQELTTDAGKKQLRHEIQEQVGPFFTKPKLVDVMFTEFVIQL